MNIYKLRPNTTIDFAAEELKKYLRMMMPGKGDVTIDLRPDAKDGFRLGLFEDFNIPCESTDPYQDDIVHIEASAEGGILAGSNPRSVLFAVYRLLKLNGCRFFYPGAEGEYIPMKDLEPTSYHKMADHRLRGHSLEGAASLEQTLAYIDFHAKEELNTFSLLLVDNYQTKYYNHLHNEQNRPPEEYDGKVAESQWRALYECELTKRGIRIISGEHDLIPTALGLEMTDLQLYRSGQKQISEDLVPLLAFARGRRHLYNRNIIDTNLCYSNPKARELIVNRAVEMAQEKPYLDYLGVGLADSSRNHCECEECCKKRPSDWYVMLLNEVDAKFTELKIPMRILFSFYVDTMFAPLEERLNNPDRFILQFCPIARSYMASITEDIVLPEPLPYIRNAWTPPKNTEEAFALFREWQKVFPGPCGVFEYHFWRHQYRDPGTMAFARRVYEDSLSHRAMGTCGCTQDGSNKSYFPNGFAEYIYAETLVNRDLDYEQELKNYYSVLYGNDWEMVVSYLKRVSNAFSFAYLEGEQSSDPSRGTHYNPAHAADLGEVAELAAEIRSVYKKRKPANIRVQGLAWRLLMRHAEYCEGFAAVMMEKCVGHDRLALEKYAKFLLEFGKHDYETERYFDFNLAASANAIIVNRMPAIEQ